MSQSGQLGSGVGKGGGAGGSVREAGGTLGKMGAAKEEAFFKKKDAEQLNAIRNAQSTSQGSSDKKTESNT